MTDTKPPFDEADQSYLDKIREHMNKGVFWSGELPIHPNDIAFLLRLLNEAIAFAKQRAAEARRETLDMVEQHIAHCGGNVHGRLEAMACDHHWIGGNDGVWCTKCKEERP